MAFKNTKIILFASLITAMILPFGTMNYANAAFGPQFSIELVEDEIDFNDKIHLSMTQYFGEKIFVVIEYYKPNYPYPGYHYISTDQEHYEYESPSGFHLNVEGVWTIKTWVGSKDPNYEQLHYFTVSPLN